MAKNETVTLYAPTGEKYETGSVMETVQLKSLGYTEKKPTPTQIAAVVGKS